MTRHFTPDRTDDRYRDDFDKRCVHCGNQGMDHINGCCPDQLTYHVIDAETGASHGHYDSLDQARGCVAFDGLQYYAIWHGDELVESLEPAPSRGLTPAQLKD